MGLLAVYLNLVELRKMDVDRIYNLLGKNFRDAAQTSKDVGANVEGDLEAAHNLHTFAPSKDENKSNDSNIVITIKIVKGMKKIFFALVAMVMMTMSANAQSIDDRSKLTFDRLASYLELTVNQIEPVKKAMAQFDSSLEVFNQLQDTSDAGKAWEKIQARHKATMKKVLNEKQYDKYVKTLDLTVRNTADRMTDQLTATR